MGKWATLLLVIAIAAGLALWLMLDPQARAVATRAWYAMTSEFAREGIQIDANSLLAPILRGFQDFAESVKGMITPRAVMPLSIPTIAVP